MARGTTVRIEAFGPTRLDLDGELVESRQPYVLSVLPAALRVLV
jgi:diacylglycerol kinase family enzyme